MYEQYWQLKSRPFGNAPDPRYYYQSKQHNEALMKLQYAVTERMGGALLSGDYGCGKTMLIQVLQQQVGSSVASAVCSCQPDMTSMDLLRAIARAMSAAEISLERSELIADALLELIQKSIRENSRDGKHTLLVLDEAHMISDDSVFEVARILLNLNDKGEFQMTLLLAGHPELVSRVTALKQLSQRLPISCVLAHLNRKETEGYMKSRLAVAGRTSSPFDDTGIDAIHHDSDGIPRKINTLCDLSLALGFAQKAKSIDQSLVREAAAKFGVR